MNLRPAYADAYTGLGVSLKESKRKDEAEACFQQVVRLRPGCALSLGNLAGGCGLNPKFKVPNSIFLRSSLIVLASVPHLRHHYPRAALLALLLSSQRCPAGPASVSLEGVRGCLPDQMTFHGAGGTSIMCMCMHVGLCRSAGASMCLCLHARLHRGLRTCRRLHGEPSAQSISGPPITHSPA